MTAAGWSSTRVDKEVIRGHNEGGTMAKGWVPDGKGDNGPSKHCEALDGNAAMRCNATLPSPTHLIPGTPASNTFPDAVERRSTAAAPSVLLLPLPRHELPPSPPPLSAAALHCRCCHDPPPATDCYHLPLQSITVAMTLNITTATPCHCRHHTSLPSQLPAIIVPHHPSGQCEDAVAKTVAAAQVVWPCCDQ